MYIINKIKERRDKNEPAARAETQGREAPAESPRQVAAQQEALAQPSAGEAAGSSGKKGRGRIEDRCVQAQTYVDGAEGAAARAQYAEGVERARQHAGAHAEDERGAVARAAYLRCHKQVKRSLFVHIRMIFTATVLRFV